MDKGMEQLIEIWNSYPPSITKKSLAKSKKNELHVHAEFFFCLLGGYGITYELNQSAFDVLSLKGLFNLDNYKKFNDLMIELLERELSLPQFAPKTKNGNLRKYRFPTAKAKTIFNAAKWIIENYDSNLLNLLNSSNNERTLRLMLNECPGIGMKTSSWFLRNIGFADNLAIIDIHIIRFLKDFSYIPISYSPEKHYEEIEEILQNICQSIKLPIDKVDLLLWDWMRTMYKKDIKVAP